MYASASSKIPSKSFHCLYFIDQVENNMMAVRAKSIPILSLSVIASWRKKYER
jgi:hypothetical protein